MGFIKNWAIGSHAINPKELAALKESVRLIKLKRATETKTERLQSKLIELLDLYHNLRIKGIPVPHSIIENLDYIESNLGIKFHQSAQTEEIENHDMDSAERIIDETLVNLTGIKAVKARRAA